MTVLAKGRGADGGLVVCCVWVMACCVGGGAFSDRRDCVRESIPVCCDSVIVLLTCVGCCFECGPLTGGTGDTCLIVADGTGDTLGGFVDLEACQ